MKIDRLIGILAILLRQEKVTAPVLAERFEVSRPLIMTFPSDGTSIHPIMLRMVDFPEPEGPIIETKSPLSMSKETPFMAETSVFPRV